MLRPPIESGLVPAVNVDGAETVARVALETGVRRLVHCSSIHAFDMQASGPVLDETAARVPTRSRAHGAYDRSKAEGERRVRAVIERGLDAVVIHPSSVIGPFDFEPSLMGSVFLRLYRRSLPGLVVGGFDFVDVRDVSAGLLAAADRGSRGESYLLGGHFRTLRELADLAARVTGKAPPRFTFPPGVARVGIPFLWAWARLTRSEPLYTSESLGALQVAPEVDTSKAERDLGYAARPLEQTVGDLYRWFAVSGRLPAGGGSGGEDAA